MLKHLPFAIKMTDVVDNNKICRLCLNSYDTKYELIQDPIIEMLKYLLLEIDLSITDNPLICDTCKQIMGLCYDFKSVCLITQDCINAFDTESNKWEFDLRNVYVKMHPDTEITKDHNVCRLCMKLLNKASLISLYRWDMEMKLQKYIPEIVVNAMEDSVICVPCSTKLESYSKFIEIWLNVRDIIKKYSDNNNGHVDLHRICKLESHLKYKERDIYNPREISFLKMKLIVKAPKQIDLKNKGNDIIPGLHRVPRIKNNETSKTPLNTPIQEKALSVPLGRKEQNNVKLRLKPLDTMLPKEKPSGLLNTTNSDLGKVTSPPSSASLVQKSPSRLVSYQKQTNDNKKTFDSSNTISVQKKGDSKPLILYRRKTDNSIVLKKTTTKLYKCSKCPFKTIRKSNFESHTFSHKMEMNYKCGICCTKTNREDKLARHMLLHRRVPGKKLQYSEH